MSATPGEKQQIPEASTEDFGTFVARYIAKLVGNNLLKPSESSVSAEAPEFDEAAILAWLAAWTRRAPPFFNESRAEIDRLSTDAKGNPTDALAGVVGKVGVEQPEGTLFPSNMKLFVTRHDGATYVTRPAADDPSNNEILWWQPNPTKPETAPDEVPDESTTTDTQTPESTAPNTSKGFVERARSLALRLLRNAAHGMGLPGSGE